MRYYGGPFVLEVQNFEKINELVQLFSSIGDCRVAEIESSTTKYGNWSKVIFVCTTTEALTKLVSTIEELKSEP